MWKKLGFGSLLGMLLLLSVVGTAAAQVPDDGGQVTAEDDLFARMAESMGMSRETLLETLLEGETLQGLMDQYDIQPPDWTGRGGPRRRPGGLHPEISLEMTATTLGMEPEEVREALQAGQTLLDLIEAQGLDEAEVVEELKDGAIDRINEAVEAGRLSEQRAERMVERIEAGDLESLLDRGWGGEPSTPMPPVGLDTLADALGMSEDALQAAMDEGQTIPEIVEAEGLSTEGVADDLKNAIVERVGDAVADGELAEERADAMLERLEDSDGIEQWLAGEAPFPRNGRGMVDQVRKWLQVAPKALRFLGRRLPLRGWRQ